MANFRRSRVFRSRFFRFAACLGMMALALPGHGVAGDSDDHQSMIIQKLLPAVVSISVKKDAPVTADLPADAASKTAATTGSSIKYYVGSGFVIDPSGLVLTNDHVVRDAFAISVKFSDGTILQGQTVHTSRLADLAIVKVDAGHPLAAIHWGSSEALQIGDQVFVVGNPFGVGLSVTGGIVSALNRNLMDTAYDDYIQTDAAINHGNSGGPLFDMDGDVVGVNTELVSPTKGFSGLGFAIPADTARFVVNQLETYGWDRPAWIGVKVQELTPELADAEGVDRPGGSIISWVIPGGPSDKAGLVIGDVILRFNDGMPTDDRALLRDISHTMVGTTIKLRVRHNGAEETVPVVTEVWPRDQWEAHGASSPTQRPSMSTPRNLGLFLSAISPADRLKLGLQQGLDGVLVDSVEAASDAAHQGMKAGDIILRVQDQTVSTPAEVQSGIDAVRALKRGYLQMLVLPKDRTVPGPRWRALQVGDAGHGGEPQARAKG